MPKSAQSILIAEGGDIEAALGDVLAHYPQADIADLFTAVICSPAYEG